MPALALLLCFLSPLVLASGDELLLRNANVVNVETGQIDTLDVLVRKGRIAAIEKPGRIETTPKAIDLTGRYLMPSLWDMHVHFEGRDLVEDNALLLPVYLAYGITAVREAASNLAPTVLAWREEVARGDRLGPRIFTAGRKFEGINSLWDGDREIGSVAELRAGMDEQQRLGVDFIKVTENTLQPDLFLETVREARRRGLTVSTHVPLGLGIFELAEAGVSSIEHASYLLRLGSADEEKVALAVREGRMGPEAANQHYRSKFEQETANAAYQRLAELGVAVTPTLIGGRQLAWLQDTDHSDDEFLRFLTQAFTANYQWRIDRMAGETDAERQARKSRYTLTAAQVPALQSAGVLLLAGSDSAALNTYVYPAEALHEELSLFVDAGLEPLAALQAATINGAIFMGVDEEYGSVSVGKRADLLVLEGNPLETIHATRHIHALVHGGRYLDRAALDGLLNEAGVKRARLDVARSTQP